MKKNESTVIDHPLLLPIVEIAREASNVIMEVYATTFKSEWKEDNSPVTEADIRAHHIIAAGLKDLTPEITIISEEGRHPKLEAEESFWLVDPLDGTKSFIRRDGEFTVNIALIEKARPVFGVMALPATGEVYAGIKGKGAYKASFSDIQWHSIGTRQVPAEGYAVVASKSHKSAGLVEWLAPFDVAQEVQAGSALKFARVAEGGADLYPRLGPTMEWDTAAGHAILEAAGGQMTDLNGNPFLYNKKAYKNGGFVASGAVFRHPSWQK